MVSDEPVLELDPSVDAEPRPRRILVVDDDRDQADEPGAAFPASDPVFVLVAEQPGIKTALIGIAGGSYANGAKATKLKVGKQLTLVNTTTGARYRVVLIAVGNGETATATSEPTP